MNEGAFRKALVVLIIFGVLTKVIVSFQNGISDPDTWWHLAAGKYIADLRAVPHQDIFSWTVAGQPWITHEWLLELLFYLSYLVGKFWGVLALVLFLCGTLLLFYWKLLSMPKDSFYVAALALLVTGELITPFIDIRPQVLSYLLFVFFLYALYSFVYEDRDFLFALPLLSLLWANSHGSFLLGAALLVLFIFSVLIPMEGGKIVNPRFRISKAGKLTLVLILCLVTPTVNPNGFKLLLYPFETLGNSQMTGTIQEWLSPNFHDLYYQVFLVYYLATFLVLVITPRNILLSDLLLYLIFGAAAFIHIRLIPYALLTSGLLWPRYLSLKTTHLPKLSRIKIAVIPSLFIPFMLVLFLKAPPQTQIDYKFTPQDSIFPVKAVEYLRANPVTGRMLNDYGWGGYLIWNLPEHKVFIDGRADVYFKKVYGDYLKVNRLKPETAFLLNKYRVGFVLMPADAPLIQALKFSPDWSVCYEDTKAAILVNKKWSASGKTLTGQRTKGD